MGRLALFFAVTAVLVALASSQIDTNAGATGFPPWFSSILMMNPDLGMRLLRMYYMRQMFGGGAGAGGMLANPSNMFLFPHLFGGS